jgi:membrane-anchored protein YejM (alkaline phosphatase superfamily)
MQRPPLTPEEIAWLDKLNQDRLETLLAADEAVAQSVETLEAVGRRENTYVVFTSDNGYALGEHQDEAKSAPL